ncbi:hypothetical protein UNDKW_4043 [Undibacterium sp. KW1]|nr:hypothetical protein UNDKW_4038 [Undibacterium sp. KW1]BBB62316.1 hypothetical protein UNDKW_4043 [Undibacterium sp. KW1]
MYYLAFELLELGICQRIGTGDSLYTLTCYVVDVLGDFSLAIDIGLEVACGIVDVQLFYTCRVFGVDQTAQGIIAVAGGEFTTESAAEQVALVVVDLGVNAATGVVLDDFVVGVVVFSVAGLLQGIGGAGLAAQTVVGVAGLVVEGIDCHQQFACNIVGVPGDALAAVSYACAISIDLGVGGGGAELATGVVTVVAAGGVALDLGGAPALQLAQCQWVVRS